MGEIFLLALQRKDGKEKWRFKAGPFKASAAVRDGRVYCPFCSLPGAAL